MKKVSKILFFVLLMVILSTAVVTPVFAANNTTDDGYSPIGYTGANSGVKVENLESLGQNIIKVLTTAGSIISVIVLVVLGIKYMMGSAEEKAEYKKTLMPYIIGAAFVFAASTIATVIFNFASSF